MARSAINGDAHAQPDKTINGQTDSRLPPDTAHSVGCSANGDHPPPRSEAQKAASRRNGSLSRGPATDAGKRRSRANALKAGVFSENPRVWARHRADKLALARCLRLLRERYGNDDVLMSAELWRHADDRMTLDRYYRIRAAVLAEPDIEGRAESDVAKTLATSEKYTSLLNRLRRVADRLFLFPVGAELDSRTAESGRELAHWIARTAGGEGNDSDPKAMTHLRGRLSFAGQGWPGLTDIDAVERLLMDFAHPDRSALLGVARRLLDIEHDEAEARLIEALTQREMLDLATVSRLPTIDAVERQITRVSRRVERVQVRLDARLALEPPVPIVRPRLVCDSTEGT